MSITAAVPELLLVSWHLDRICDLVKHDGKLSYFPPAQQNDQTGKKKKTNRSYMLHVVYGVSVCLSVYFTQSFALSARNNLRRCEKRTPSTYDLYTL